MPSHRSNFDGLKLALAIITTRVQAHASVHRLRHIVLTVFMAARNKVVFQTRRGPLIQLVVYEGGSLDCHRIASSLILLNDLATLFQCIRLLAITEIQ